MLVKKLHSGEMVNCNEGGNGVSSSPMDHLPKQVLVVALRPSDKKPLRIRIRGWTNVLKGITAVNVGIS